MKQNLISQLKTSALLALVVGALVPATSSRAAIITIDPADVSASTQIGGGFNRQDDFIVNGSGLSGGAHTTAVEPNMWLSAGTAFGGDDLDPFVLFDLGGVYTISSFQVWNYNEVAPNGTNLTARGVNSVSVEYGITAALGSTVPGITNFAQADGLATYAGQEFNGFAPFDAQFIKFDINSNHGGDNNFYGLSEVQFDGVLVPESSTAALLGCGAIGLLLRRRRR